MAGHLVKTDDIVLAKPNRVASCIVHEHLRDRGLTTGNEMRVREICWNRWLLPGSAVRQARSDCSFAPTNGTIRKSATRLARSFSVCGSNPMERNRNSIHCCVPKTRRPRAY